MSTPTARVLEGTRVLVTINGTEHGLEIGEATRLAADIKRAADHAAVNACALAMERQRESSR